MMGSRYSDLSILVQRRMSRVCAVSIATLRGTIRRSTACSNLQIKAAKYSPSSAQSFLVQFLRRNGLSIFPNATTTPIQKGPHIATMIHSAMQTMNKKSRQSKALGLHTLIKARAFTVRTKGIDTLCRAAEMKKRTIHAQVESASVQRRDTKKHTCKN